MAAYHNGLNRAARFCDFRSLTKKRAPGGDPFGVVADSEIVYQAGVAAGRVNRWRRNKRRDQKSVKDAVALADQGNHIRLLEQIFEVGSLLERAIGCPSPEGRLVLLVDLAALTGKCHHRGDVAHR